MKSPTALIIGAALALLAGCGQPGALYMPKPPAKSAAAPAAAPTPPSTTPAAQ